MSPSRELHATVICLQDRKILLVRKGSAQWSLPGGKIAPGETQLEAARRELLEEASLQLTDAQFLSHHLLANEEHWLYRMAVSLSAVPHPSHEIVECRWFEVDEVLQVPVKRSSLELLKREGLLTDRDCN